MGRYYSGDIEGKFWFAVQDSNDADFFGVEGTQSEELNYYFEKKDLSKVEKGISECLNFLGENKELFDEFFNEGHGYNKEMIIDFYKKKGKIISEEEIKILLEWYARLELGEKIKDCIIEQDYCSFTAEC